MIGGQVHDSQVVEETLNTPRSPLAVTADKAHDSEKIRQQIKDEGALPIIPNRCSATKKAYCPKRFYRRRHKIENFFCRIKDSSQPATTSLPATSWPPLRSSAYSTGSNCESSPFCDFFNRIDHLTSSLLKNFLQPRECRDSIFFTNRRRLACGAHLWIKAAVLVRGARGAGTSEPSAEEAP